MLRTLLYLFVAALALNFLWEEAHAQLYVHYQGMAITHWLLLRAALFDATFTAVFLSPFFYFEFLARRVWIFVAFALVFAIGLELWALDTGRWSYTEAMPLVPFLGSGLTPTVQLALLGYLSYTFARRATR